MGYVVCGMVYVACARCLQERTDSSRRARRQHVYPSALGACSAAACALNSVKLLSSLRNARLNFGPGVKQLATVVAHCKAQRTHERTHSTKPMLAAAYCAGPVEGRRAPAASARHGATGSAAPVQSFATNPTCNQSILNGRQS
jgi:hypothetical protein